MIVFIFQSGRCCIFRRNDSRVFGILYPRARWNAPTSVDEPRVCSPDISIERDAVTGNIYDSSIRPTSVEIHNNVTGAAPLQERSFAVNKRPVAVNVRIPFAKTNGSVRIVFVSRPRYLKDLCRYAGKVAGKPRSVVRLVASGRNAGVVRYWFEFKCDDKFSRSAKPFRSALTYRREFAKNVLIVSGRPRHENRSVFVDSRD